ncbi:hypothetical protein [Pyrobaculum neutrophilum]|uniref:Uncharacterized protein n=1 Tax=Pyrobaculum neutrophilum (strain DSM 2338 / JCM 9278 / NBRC 100436 / V24Sta) TaxID=444157 RepID=B1Y9P2_PYRNV|nr:hypothetical protein [Pyrobaculum neutrophilum]ACB38964.1 conserved hypothetical protein [Pyrobaculum neutrophilum V24Sta]
MRFEIVERKLVEALIILLINAKGRVVSIKATSLAKLAGLGTDHSAILRAARLLQKLSRHNFLSTAPDIKRNKTYRYVLKEDDELWQLARRDPERAKELLVKILHR